MRRLPIYLVLDVSESMAGDPLAELGHTMESIVDSLRQDPHALESVHLSVIAFAGKAQLIVPMVELMTFYPPRLPLGGGTALGAALDELMTRIEVDVKKTTADQRGDWEPIVYLLTDGRPTDNTDHAIARWQRHFASRAHLIAVTLGPAADLALLKRLTDDVVAMESASAEALGRFAKWVTASVAAQSQAIDIAEGTSSRLSIAKAEEVGINLIKQSDVSSWAPMDERVAVFTGRCHRTSRPYLLKYASVAVPGTFGTGDWDHFYGLEGCYPLEESYFEWSSIVPLHAAISTSQIEGVPPCPHCGARTTLAKCSCGKLMCCNGPGVQQCPWCDQSVEFVAESHGAGFDMTRGLG